MPVAHLDLVRQQPCLVCGARPSTAHHAVGASMLEHVGVRGGRKHSDYYALSLCPRHHQNEEGIHRLGAKTFEARFGTQVDMLILLGQRLGKDLFALAEQEALDKRSSRRAKAITKRSKPYTAPTKQVPRNPA